MSVLTITTTAPQDARLVAAFGAKLGTLNAQGAPRGATASEIKADIISYVRAVVADQERLAAVAAQQAAAAAFDPT